jgi:hypothetical protein
MPRKTGPLLPKGGYKRLTTKKKLAETAAFYAGISAKMLSGGNTEPARAAYGTKRGRGRPRSNKYVPSSRVKRTATPKQLAALAKARAARAVKRQGNMEY